MTRRPGLSVRVKLTLSYAGFLVVAGGLLLSVVWVFLLRYVPAGPIDTGGPFVPNRGDLIRAFAPAVGWALFFLLLFGVLGGWFLAGRMLAPLTLITTATRKAAAGSLSHRIDMAGRQDEFRELADSFDTMLARLEAQVVEEQRFAANASHELRTPLAITQALLEVARADPLRDVDGLIARLSEVNARAIELTEALLLLSKVDRGTLVREPVDLSLLAEEAAETLLPLAEQRGVTLEHGGVVARARGSAALLAQLTRNLVHNAIVHNRAQGGFVRIETLSRGNAATLVVENSGDPVDPASLTSLTEPFQRGSERVRTDHVGAGLGLAIVTSIVRVHEGTLLLTTREGGGLRVEVRLPSA